MTSTLLILQRNIDQYHDFGEADFFVKEDALAELCHNILVEQAHIYRQSPNKDIAESMSDRCYRLLTQLLNETYALPKADKLFTAISHLMNSFELCYGQHIQPDNILALCEVDRLHCYVKDRLGPILLQLKNKGIRAIFLDEIQHAMDSLFENDKNPQLQYYHRQYIPRLIQTLGQMASDCRPKNWQYRLIATLVGFNFNYLGFYNRWAQYQDELLEQAAANGKSKEALLSLEKEICTYQQHAQIGYNIHDRDLKAYMQEYLRLERKQLKQAQDITSASAYSFIPFNANGNQLKLLFHVFYKVDLFAAENKEEAAKHIAPNVRTREGNPLTVQSLAKHDKAKLEDQYPFVIRKLKDTVKILEEEYRESTKK
ncbi:hypothetical protein [Sphingobacterium tabacisoli]|uniref:Uncharacterized protein n=1 Tax=Sphingobacterium tabacisoli TaxID=2044855 RepID=A0ABW5L364_9SPHI|nr:hypothetical protein [Sphingobacterium tabacisoli]